jgi:excisionase family DNA binding protein
VTTARLIDPADLMTVPESADLLGVTRQRVLQIIQRGGLAPVLQRPRMTLLHREDVEAYAARRREPVPA